MRKVWDHFLDLGFGPIVLHIIISLAFHLEDSFHSFRRHCSPLPHSVSTEPEAVAQGLRLVRLPLDSLDFTSTEKRSSGQIWHAWNVLVERGRRLNGLTVYGHCIWVPTFAQSFATKRISFMLRSRPVAVVRKVAATGPLLQLC